MPESAGKERQIPVALIVLGVALYVVAAFTAAGTVGAVKVFFAVLIGGIIQTAILLGAAMIVAAVMSVSFGPPATAALKFAGATLASGGIAALLPFGGGIVAIFIFLGLIMFLFDLELTYAVVLTVMYFVVSYVVRMILNSVLSR